MTAFNSLGNPELGPNKIARSVTAYALYNNPIAIAERDATAPHLNTTPLVSVFTASGSWVVPTGVTRAKVTVTGGGGGGNSTGGTTSVTRGATNLCRATGGGGSTSPGVGTHGDILISGGHGGVAGNTYDGGGTAIGTHGGHGGASMWGGGGRGGLADSGSNENPGSDGEAYGSGGGGESGAQGAPETANPGLAAGGSAIAWITVTPGETLTVTIGAGGTGGLASNGDGAPGVVVIEY